MAQPNEWAEDSLREAWRAYLEPKLQKQYDAGQLGRGMSTQDWQVTKEGFLEDVSVRKVLLGLWEVDEQYVVEGECPVRPPAVRVVSGADGHRCVERLCLADMDRPTLG